MSFDLENAPKTERKTEAQKKKEKAPKETALASTQDSVVESTKEALNSSTPGLGEGEKGGQRKNIKDKQKAAAAEPGNSKGSTSKKGNVAKPLVADEGDPVPSMIDLRVGHIVDGELPIFYVFG